MFYWVPVARADGLDARDVHVRANQLGEEEYSLVVDNLATTCSPVQAMGLFRRRREIQIEIVNVVTQAPHRKIVETTSTHPFDVSEATAWALRIQPTAVETHT